MWPGFVGSGREGVMVFSSGFGVWESRGPPCSFPSIVGRTGSPAFPCTRSPHLQWYLKIMATIKSHASGLQPGLKEFFPWCTIGWKYSGSGGCCFFPPSFEAAVIDHSWRWDTVDRVDWSPD